MVALPYVKHWEAAKDMLSKSDPATGKKEPVVVFELLARKGQLDEKKRRVVEVYLEGLAAYKTRNFSTACARFSEAVALDPSDGPSRVYLERSANYRQTPPPSDWDGVYELTAK